MVNSLSHCVYYVANFRHFVWCCGQKAIWKSTGYLMQSVSIIWIIWHPGGMAVLGILHWCLRLFGSIALLLIKLYVCTLYIGKLPVNMSIHMNTVMCTVDCQVYKNHISLENLKDYFYPIETMFTFVTLICLELFLHFYIYFMVSFLLVKVLQ